MRLIPTHDPVRTIQCVAGRNAQVVGGTDYFGCPVFPLFLPLKFYGDNSVYIDLPLSETS